MNRSGELLCATTHMMQKWAKCLFDRISEIEMAINPFYQTLVQCHLNTVDCFMWSTDARTELDAWLESAGEKHKVTH